MKESACAGNTRGNLKNHKEQFRGHENLKPSKAETSELLAAFSCWLPCRRMTVCRFAAESELQSELSLKIIEIEILISFGVRF